MMYRHSEAETQVSTSNMIYRRKEGGPVSYQYQEYLLLKKGQDKQNLLDGYQNSNNSLVDTEQRVDSQRKSEYKKLIRFLVLQSNSSVIRRKGVKNQSKNQNICLETIENILQQIAIGQWKSEKHVIQVLKKLAYFIKNALVEKQSMLQPHFFSKYLETNFCSSKNVAKHHKSSLILKSDRSMRNKDKEYQKKIRQVQLLYEIIKGNYQEIQQPVNEARRFKRLNHRKQSIL